MRRRSTHLLLLRAARSVRSGVGSGSGCALASSREVAGAATTSDRRFLSTTPDEVDGSKDDNLHRPLRLLLFATLCGAAAAVLPQTFAPSPQAAVALLGAESATLRASGAERARRLVGDGKGAELLASAPNAASALLDAAFREGGGTGEEGEMAAREAALSAAVAWARHPAGRRALLDAGGAERAVASSATSEDARHLSWLLREARENE